MILTVIVDKKFNFVLSFSVILVLFHSYSDCILPFLGLWMLCGFALLFSQLLCLVVPHPLKELKPVVDGSFTNIIIWFIFRKRSLFLVQTPPVTAKVCLWSYTYLLKKQFHLRNLKLFFIYWSLSICAGGQLDTGPSTALPDKKLLLFILDRLQKYFNKLP